MYALLILVALSGSGKSITMEQIQFDSKKLCEQAKQDLDAASRNSFYDRYTTVCMKVK